MNKDIKKQIIDLMESAGGFLANNNYKLVSIKEGFCKVEGIIDETSLNPYGIAHGGYIFGLADTAGGLAVASFGKKAVTTSATINYLHKGKGERLIAEATCFKAGNTVTNCDVLIFDDNNNLVAKAMIEYFYV